MQCIACIAKATENELYSYFILHYLKPNFKLTSHLYDMKFNVEVEEDNGLCKRIIRNTYFSFTLKKLLAMVLFSTILKEEVGNLMTPSKLNVLSLRLPCDISVYDDNR